MVILQLMLESFFNVYHISTFCGQSIEGCLRLFDR